MVQYLTSLPAGLMLAACGYYYIGWVEKPQHGLFYAAMLGVLWQYRRALKHCLTHPLMQVLGGYVVYQVISLCWSPLGNAEEVGEALRKGGLSLLFLLSFALCWRREQFREQWISVMVVVASVSATLALALQYDAARLEGLGRSLNAVQAGCLYGFALLLAAWLTQRQHKAWTICWLVLFWALLETASRGALLAAVLGHGLLWWRPRYCIVIAALVGVVCISLFPELLQRADGFRFLIWQEAWQQMHGHWLLGLGYRAPFEVTLPYGQTIYQPHSIYVTALYYGGVVGLGALLAVLAAAWRYAQHPLTKALVLFAAIIGLFDYNLLLVNGEIEWLLFWLPWAMVLAEKSKHENPTQSF